MIAEPRRQLSLRLAGIDLRRQLRRLERPGSVCAVGELVLNHGPRVTQWSVVDWRPAHRWPTGNDFSLLHRWAVFVPADRLAVTDRTKAVDPTWWRRRLRPLPGQQLIVLVVGIGTGRRGWCGFHFQADEARPIDELVVVGNPSMRLSADEAGVPDRIDPVGSRWTRLSHALTPALFARLRRQHVMIFGASRNGSTVARQLAALGVRRLSLVDPDLLEPHNLDAMLGGDVTDIGRPKVEALAGELIRFRDDLAVTCLPWTATDRRVIEHARTADIYFTCVDRGTAVLLAAKMANRWTKIHVDVGTEVQHGENQQLQLFGDVRLFFPHEACAACVGGIPDQEEAELELRLPAGVVPLRPQIDFREQRAGSLVTINAIAAATAVQNLVNALSGELKASTWTRFQWDQRGLNQEFGIVVSPVRCMICGSGQHAH